METLDKGAVEAVATLTRQTGLKVASVSLPQPINGLPSSVPILLDPENGKAGSLYELLAPWRTKPERKRGTARVETLESFRDLVSRHKQGNSAIFAITNWEKPSFTAVIDYHDETNPDNGQHRIHYQFPLSEEWKAWNAVNNKPLDQAKFAEFLEDHIADLTTPTLDEAEDFRKMFGAEVGLPNDVLMVSRGLQVNVETNIKQTLKLQTGETQLIFEETHKSAGGGPVTVPGVFLLQLAPFFMGETCRIPVRLRYRKSNESLVWIIQLYRPDLHITSRVRDDLKATAEALDLPAFEGTPEMPAA